MDDRAAAIAARVPGAVPRRGGPRPLAAREALAGGVPPPGLRPRRGLGTRARAADAPVRGVRAPGPGHRRRRAPRQPPAAAVPRASPLPLRTRSLAAWLAATPKNGIPARQPWFQLGPGGHESAWPLLRKPRRATVDPEREPSAGPVEVDGTGPPSRAGGGPARPGRSHDGR